MAVGYMAAVGLYMAVVGLYMAMVYMAVGARVFMYQYNYHGAVVFEKSRMNMLFFPFFYFTNGLQACLYIFFCEICFQREKKPSICS